MCVEFEAFKLVGFLAVGFLKQLMFSDVFNQVFVINVVFSVDKIQFLVEMTYYSGCIISLHGSFMEFLFKFAKSATN